MGGPSILTPTRRESARPAWGFLTRARRRDCDASRGDAARMSNASGRVERVQPEPFELRFELGPDALRSAWIGEENGAERDGGGSRGDELERVAAGRHAAHADDRKRRRTGAAEHRGERDRPQRRPRIAAGG